MWRINQAPFAAGSQPFADGPSRRFIGTFAAPNALRLSFAQGHTVISTARRHAARALAATALALPLLATGLRAQLPGEVPAKLTPTNHGFDYIRRDVDDRDARRREAAHGDPGAEGSAERADPAHAHAIRRDGAHLARAERPPRPDPHWLRQRHRGDHRGRLHPRHPGRARQVRLRGRLRDEPPAARAAESHQRRPLHRHVRHHRLAREAHAREQRQGRHTRHFVRRVPAAHGARESAPGTQGLRCR